MRFSRDIRHVISNTGHESLASEYAKHRATSFWRWPFAPSLVAVRPCAPGVAAHTLRCHLGPAQISAEHL